MISKEASAPLTSVAEETLDKDDAFACLREIEKMTEQNSKTALVSAGTPLASGLQAYPELKKAAAKIDEIMAKRTAAADKTLTTLAAYRERLGQYISTIEAFNNGGKEYMPALASWRWAEDPEAAAANDDDDHAPPQPAAPAPAAHPAARDDPSKRAVRRPAPTAALSSTHAPPVSP